MKNLIKTEFRKIFMAPYFLASFLSILLSPVLAFIMMSLSPNSFMLGDFNKVNILLLSVVASKLFFPFIAMSLIQVGHGLAGLKSAFLMPNNRLKIIFSKVLMAFLWMCALIIFSIILVIVIELILFRDLEIVSIVATSYESYLKIIIYAFPIQVVAMFMTLVIGNIMLPVILFALVMIGGYFVQLTLKLSYLPSAIPAYIMGVDRPFVHINIAFMINYGLGIVFFIFLSYLLIHQDYID